MASGEILDFLAEHPELLLLGLLFLLPVRIIKRSKGKLGEFKINAGLGFRLDGNVYRLLKDVTLPAGEGTTQIDHLVVPTYGIFVIETKNMKGWIFGSPDDARWTQQIYHYKHRFQNPLRQNYKHVKTVQELLGLGRHQVHNVVVFVGDCALMTPMPEQVVYGVSELADYITSMRLPVIAETEVPHLVDRILDKRLRPGLWTNLRHVRNIRREAANRTANVGACPRCGGVMAVRTNRHSGETFMGCKRYPRCRGTCPIP